MWGTTSKTGRLHHSLYRAGQGNKDYNPRRQGIAVYRDLGGFYAYRVAVRLTVASLPYLAAGVSSLAQRFGYKHNEGLAAPSWAWGWSENEP